MIKLSHKNYLKNIFYVKVKTDIFIKRIKEINLKTKLCLLFHNFIIH